MWKTNFRSLLTLSGAIIGLAGVAMLYAEQLSAERVSSHSEWGFLFLIAGCISWSLGTIYAKYRSCHEEEVNAFAGSAWQMIFASAIFWICSLVNGDVATVNIGTVAPASWASLGYLILFGSLLAYSAYVWLLKVRPATEVGTHAYVNLFIAVLLGVWLGHEQVSAIELCGLIVILLGVMLISGFKRK